jgi:hypothetical protein
MKAGGNPVLAPGLHWLRWGFLAFASQVALIYGVSSSEQGRAWLPLLLPAAHLLLLPFLLRNLSFWGVRLILFGLILNLTAMAANGGLMPVGPGAVEAVGRDNLRDLEFGAAIPRSKNVLLQPADMHLRELSDSILLPLPKPFTRVVSIGDMFVLAGVVLAYTEVIRRNSSTRVGVIS